MSRAAKWNIDRGTWGREPFGANVLACPQLALPGPSTLPRVGSGAGSREAGTRGLFLQRAFKVKAGLWAVGQADAPLAGGPGQAVCVRVSDQTHGKVGVTAAAGQVPPPQQGSPTPPPKSPRRLSSDHVQGEPPLDSLCPGGCPC